MNEKYQDLVGRDISRKDFLKLIGGGVVVLFGLSNFIGYLSHFQRTGKAKAVTDNLHGFGSRKFGA